jgi:hypothetical protein
MEKDLYDLEILRQPKHGPLDIYRKKASFDCFLQDGRYKQQNVFALKH